jgi:hypothetical protein
MATTKSTGETEQQPMVLVDTLPHDEWEEQTGERRARSVYGQPTPRGLDAPRLRDASRNSR